MSAKAQQGLAWAGIALLVALVAVVVFGGQPRIASLAGVWDGTRVADGAPVRVHLPGLFANHGLPPDAHVRLSRVLEIPDDGVRRALWFEHPQYAVTVSWDGREVGRGGDPERPDGARSDRSLVVVLPKQPGRHTLALELRGDFGEGGATGRIGWGPLEEIERAVRANDAQRVSLALVIAMVAVVQLVIAARRGAGRSHLLLGIFAGALAAWAYSHTDAAHDILGLVGRLRARRVMLGIFPPFGLAFVSTFLYGRTSGAVRATVAVGLGTAALGVVIPAGWLYALEQLQDVLLVAVLGWIAAWCVRGALAGSRWALVLLVAALPPLVVAAVADVLVSHGLTESAAAVFPAATLFTVGLSGALALRHASDATRHERLLDGSPDAILSVDRVGRIEAVNPAAGQLFGPHVEGEPLFELVAPEDAALLGVHLSCRVPRAELRLRRHPARVYESVVTSLGEDAVLLVLRDVTRRRELDGVVIQAARLETLGVLVGGIAHDFNNMLGTLLAQLGYLQLSTTEPGASERLQRMEATVERASLLVRRMLTVARGTSPELVAVDLSAVCAGARDLVEPTLPEGVTLAFDVPDDLPPVLGAAGDLEQVLVNLMVNARDAVGAGGTIAVVARPVTTEDARLVVIAVEDDGPGVPDDRKEEIFLPFVSSKSPRRGSGLGLAVASRILRDHLGRLWVEDRPGGGACFLAALRVADEDRTDESSLPAYRRLLLVEDELELLDSYAEALRRSGYEVDTATTGEDAALLLKARRPAILVTDVVMPGRSGVDLAETCNALYPEVPVLLVSGYIPEQGFSRVGDGRWYRLDKPVRPARLVAEVGRICRRAERGLHARDATSIDTEASLHGLTAALLEDAR